MPQNTPIFYDNDTLLAPNSRGEMTLYTVVEPTWEVNIPDASDKTVNVTGAADKVIEYINVNFPHYRWPNVDDLDTVSPEKTAQDGPNCRVFQQAPYSTADICRKTLKQIGNHYFNLGAGPGTCAQAECRTDFYGHQAAIWWCNDVSDNPQAVAHVYLGMVAVPFRMPELIPRSPTYRAPPRHVPLPVTLPTWPLSSCGPAPSGALPIPGLGLEASYSTKPGPGMSLSTAARSAGRGLYGSSCEWALASGQMRSGKEDLGRFHGIRASLSKMSGFACH